MAHQVSKSSQRLTEYECSYHKKHYLQVPVTKCYLRVYHTNSIENVKYSHRTYFEINETLNNHKKIPNLKSEGDKYFIEDFLPCLPTASVKQLGRETCAIDIWFIIFELFSLLKSYQEKQIKNILLCDKKFWEFLELCVFIVPVSDRHKLQSIGIIEINTCYRKIKNKPSSNQNDNNCTTLLYFPWLIRALCTKTKLKQGERRVLSENQQTCVQCILKNRVSTFTNINLQDLHRLICWTTKPPCRSRGIVYFKMLKQMREGIAVKQWENFLNEQFSNLSRNSKCV